MNLIIHFITLSIIFSLAASKPTKPKRNPKFHNDDLMQGYQFYFANFV